MESEKRYLGEIVSVRSDEHYGFIGIGTVCRADGKLHDLDTNADIFVHQDECSSAIKVGMSVTFMVVPNTHRGEGKYRATGAVEVLEGELVPAGEAAVPGLSAMAPLSVSSEAAAYLSRMKVVPAATVEKVAANEPLRGVERGPEGIPQDAEGKKRLLEAFLRYLFPTMWSFHADFRVDDNNDDELEHLLREAIEDHRALGMGAQVPTVEAEVKKFKDIRKALKMIWEEDLVRRDTIIPIRYLPDLFMACPVWFSFAEGQDKSTAMQSWSSADPLPHAAVQYFCDLFPKDERWCDTFQLFNRRWRPLEMYQGEIMPPHVIRRLRKSTQYFDYVVVATPYHDVAGKEWQDPQWLRAIDPYVLGFKKGLPVFFVLARFSDAGVFPLHAELVADTIEFLKSHKDHLRKFNDVPSPYWYGGTSPSASVQNLGTRLIGHVEELLRAFEAGQLFDWLRGETDIAG